MRAPRLDYVWAPSRRSSGTTIVSWGLPGAAQRRPYRPSDARSGWCFSGRIRFERINGLAVEAAAGGDLNLDEAGGDSSGSTATP